ncbi:MAG TPA: hypothetical protein VIL10_07365, partial [Marmoricola sp.]
AIAVNGARRRRPADGLDVPEDVPALRSEVDALRADLTASLRVMSGGPCGEPEVVSRERG